MRACRLDPRHRLLFDRVLGQICFLAGRDDGSVDLLAAEALLTSLAYACSLGALARTGQIGHATEALSQFLRESRRDIHSRDIPLPAKTVDGPIGGYRPTFRY